MKKDAQHDMSLACNELYAVACAGYAMTRNGMLLDHPDLRRVIDPVMRRIQSTLWR